MRDEWHGDMLRSSISTPSSQGLTNKKVGRQPVESGGDLIAGMTMAARTGKLKAKPNSKTWDMNRREISARRQVGDAESVVNQAPGTAEGQGQPWWKNVGMGKFEYCGFHYFSGLVLTPTRRGDVVLLLCMSRSARCNSFQQ